VNRLITSQWKSNQSPVASGSQTPKEGVNADMTSLPQEGLGNLGKRKAVKTRSQDKKRQKGAQFTKRC
jgi:hypothetical protein